MNPARCCNERKSRFKLRLTLPGDHPLGPGKAQLMEADQDAWLDPLCGAAMNMSYRRAWLLIDELNGMFREPVVLKAQGGKQGGGATLTPFGEELLARFRSMEKRAEKAMGGLWSGSRRRWECRKLRSNKARLARRCSPPRHKVSVQKFNNPDAMKRV